MTMLFKAKVDNRGFAVIDPIEYKNISFDYFLDETIQMNEQIHPLHELVRSVKLTSTNSGWFMVTPDGYQILMSANAFKEFGTRANSVRQPAIGYFPVIDTNLGKVALTTRSDQYAMQPDKTLIKIAQRVSAKFDQPDIRLATLSPDKVRFSVHLETTKMGTTNDDMGTGFTIINSHTGQASITVADYIERLICANGWVQRIGGNTITRTQHRWGGMQDWSMKSLARELANGNIISLPEKSKKYLFKGSLKAMSVKVQEDVFKRIISITKSSRKFVDNIEILANTPISYDSMTKYTDDVLEILINESKAEAFEKRFGLKQNKAILRNATTYSKSVRASAEQLYEDLLGQQWVLPNVFNDQPALQELNLPLKVRDFAEELGSAIAEELVVAKTTK